MALSVKDDALVDDSNVISPINRRPKDDLTTPPHRAKEETVEETSSETAVAFYRLAYESMAQAMETATLAARYQSLCQEFSISMRDSRIPASTAELLSIICGEESKQVWQFVRREMLPREAVHEAMDAAFKEFIDPEKAAMPGVQAEREAMESVFDAYVHSHYRIMRSYEFQNLRSKSTLNVRLSKQQMEIIFRLLTKGSHCVKKSAFVMFATAHFDDNDQLRALQKPIIDAVLAQRQAVQNLYTLLSDIDGLKQQPCSTVQLIAEFAYEAEACRDDTVVHVLSKRDRVRMRRRYSSSISESCSSLEDNEKVCVHFRVHQTVNICAGERWYAGFAVRDQRSHRWLRRFRFR